MGLVQRAAKRIVVYVVVAVVMAIVLSWAVEVVPFLAPVLAIASLALIGWSLLKALRSPDPKRALVMLGLSMAAGVVLGVVLNLLFGGSAATTVEAFRA